MTKTNESKWPGALAAIFVSAFAVGLLAAAAAPARAGHWRVTSETCHLFNSTTTEPVRRCPVPDSSLGRQNRQFSTLSIHIYDGSNTKRPWARNCIATWFGASFTCSLKAGEASFPSFIGDVTLSPSAKMTTGESWTDAAQLDNYAYVEIYAPENLGLEFKGIYFAW